MNPFQSALLRECEGVTHGFFGREGGVSTGVYASLNCGYGSGDNPDHVTENRGRVAKALGAHAASLLTVYQVHSADAVHVTSPWERGAAPHADAMATRLRGVALGVLAADCAPVLLADPHAGVVGAAHAGWKGAFTGVLSAVVSLMEQLGASRSGIRAVIGPCISQSSYEVGPEFHDRFVASGPANARYFLPGARLGHWQFDLPAFAADRLAEAGVQRVERTGVCTYANAGAYFSFRRTTHLSEPDYGRNLSAIMLMP